MTAFEAGRGIYADFKGGKIQNPFAQRGIEKQLGNTFEREAYSARQQARITRGIPKWETNLAKLTSNQQDILARGLSLKFGESIYEDWEKAKSAGKVKSFWDLYVTNNQTFGYLQQQADIVAKNKNFVPFKMVQGQELSRVYELSNQSEVQEALGRFWKFHDIVDQETIAKQILKTKEALGSIGVRGQIRRIKGFEVGGMLEFAFPNTSRTLTIPMVNANQIAYMGNQVSAVRKISTIEDIKKLIRLKGKIIGENPTLHILKQFENLGTNDPSELRALREEIMENIIYQEGDWGRVSNWNEAAAGIKTRSITSQTKVLDFDRLNTEEQIKFLNEVQLARGNNPIASSPNAITKGIIMEEGWNFGDYMASATESGNPFPIIRPNTLSFQQELSGLGTLVNGKFNPAISGRVLGTGRHPYTRYFSSITTETMEKTVAEAGQQLFAPRVISGPESVMNWAFKKGVQSGMSMPGEEELLVRPSLNQLGSQSTTTHQLLALENLPGLEINPQLQQILDYSKQFTEEGKYKNLYEALQWSDAEGFIQQFKDTKEQATVRNEIRKLLTLKEGTRLGYNVGANFVEAGKLGGNEFVTGMNIVDGLMNLSVTVDKNIVPGMKAWAIGSTSPKGIIRFGDERMINKTSELLAKGHLVYQKLIDQGLLEPMEKLAANETTFPLYSNAMDFLTGVKMTKEARLKVLSEIPVQFGDKSKAFMNARLFRADQELAYNMSKGVIGIHGAPTSPVTGKALGSYLDAILNESAERAFNKEIYGSQFAYRQKEIETGLGELGIERYTSEKFKEIYGREQLPEEVGIPWIRASDSKFTGAERIDKILKMAELTKVHSAEENVAFKLAMKSDINAGNFGSWVRELKEQGGKYGAKIPVDLTTEFNPENLARAEVARNELGIGLSKILGSRPLGYMSTITDARRELGAGNLATFSERFLRHLSATPGMTPEFLKYLHHETMDSMDLYKSLTQQYSAFGDLIPRKELEQKGFKVSVNDLIGRGIGGKDYFQIQNPLERTEYLKSLGAKEGQNLIIDLGGRYKYGEGESTGFLILPTDQPTLVGSQSIMRHGNLITIKHPVESRVERIARLIVENQQKGDDTIVSKELLGLRNFLGEQLGKIAPKAMTGKVLGSRQLEAAGMRGMPLLKGYMLEHASNEQVKKLLSEFEGRAFVRRKTLEQVMQERGITGGEVGALYEREPGIASIRGQFVKINPLEDVLEKLLYEEQFRNRTNSVKKRKWLSEELRQERMYIDQKAIRKQANILASEILDPGGIMIWKGSLSQTATQLDTDGDQINVKFLFEKGGIQEKQGLKWIAEQQKIYNEVNPQIEKLMIGDQNVYEQVSEIDKLLLGSKEYQKASPFMRSHYRMTALARAHKQFFKGVKPTFSMESFTSGMAEANQRLMARISEGILEKGEIGKVSNMLNYFHRATSERMGTLTPREYENAMVFTTIFEEKALKAKTGGGAGEKIGIIEKLLRLMSTPGANQKQLEANKNIAWGLTKQVIFDDLPEEAIKHMRTSSDLFYDVLYRHSQGAGKQHLANLISGKRNPERMMGYLQEALGEGAEFGSEQIALMQMLDRDKQAMYKAGKYLARGEELTQDIMTSLGKRKGLLFAGVAVAVGAGILTGRPGHIGPDQIEQDQRSVAPEMPPPANPSSATVRVLPGKFQSVNIKIPADRSMNWNAISASMQQQNPGTGAVIANVSDYRKNLSKDYIMNQLNNGR